MIYVTIRQNHKEKQLSWLDIINEENLSYSFNENGSVGTVTRTMEEAPENLLRKINVPYMIQTLRDFNEKHKTLFEVERKSLYRHFCIPKRTGGLRPIDAPCDELQTALGELKTILTENFGLLYHTSAFAYITGRSTVMEVKRHQNNQSNWFLKTDFSGFFPSTTLEFTMKMCSMIFPLSEICKVPEGKNELEKALSLAFLNGGLPQGTVLSPTLTNIICIPLDHELFNYFAHKRMVYTRYADDIHISCVQKFDYEKIVGYMKSVLHKWGAPWFIKPEKTRFGSRKGSNWMLGCMLNADNNITVGWQAKKTFKAMTTNLIMDFKHNNPWPADDVMHYQGLLSYYLMVEREYFERLIAHFNNKFKCNLREIMRNLISVS